MLPSEIKTGTKLTLQLYDDEKLHNEFISQFDYLEDDNTAVIHAPLCEGIIYPIHIGSEVYVLFALDDKLYRFKAGVSERFTRGGIAFIKIIILSEIESIQRRDYYRFGCSLSVKYRKTTEEEFLSGNVQGDFISTKTLDISGGGICLLVNEDIEINDLIESHVNLDKSTNIRFLGRVVRVSRYEQTREYKYRVGITYEIIGDEQRESIVRYIFKEQRALRSKGLI